MAVQAVVSILVVVLSTSANAAVFNPTLEWTCEDAMISIIIRSRNPFYGTAHPRGVPATDCAVIGNGTLVTSLNISLMDDSRKCGVRFNSNSELYWTQIEVHEHPLLILEQDRVFNVSCDRSAVPMRMGDEDGTRMFDDGSNSTEIEPTPTSSSFASPTVEFILELLPAPLEEDLSQNSFLSNHDVGYGQSYDMRVSLKSEEDRRLHQDRFRVSHCVAIADDTSVELINGHGCANNRKLMSDFVYDKAGFATAHIPSMFRFPRSKTMKLECKLAICEEYQLCKPMCDRILDDPIAEVEDAQMIARLLGVENDAIEEQVSDPMQTVDASGQSTSTIVHVLDRREIPPVRPDLSTASDETRMSDAVPVPAINCVNSQEFIILKYVTAFLLLLVLTGITILSIWCCLHRRRRNKKTPAGKGSTLVRNEYWISQASSPENERRAMTVYEDEGYMPYDDFPPRCASIVSAASSKQRNMATDQRSFQLHPGLVPSPPLRFRYDVPAGSRNNSTFTQSVSAESTSGASTWHESPGRNSRVDPQRESYSIH